MRYETNTENGEMGSILVENFIHANFSNLKEEAETLQDTVFNDQVNIVIQKINKKEKDPLAFIFGLITGLLMLFFLGLLILLIRNMENQSILMMILFGLLFLLPIQPIISERIKKKTERKAHQLNIFISHKEEGLRVKVTNFLERIFIQLKFKRGSELSAFYLEDYTNQIIRVIIEDDQSLNQTRIVINGNFNQLYKLQKIIDLLLLEIQQEYQEKNNLTSEDDEIDSEHVITYNFDVDKFTPETVPASRKAKLIEDERETTLENLKFLKYLLILLIGGIIFVFIVFLNGIIITMVITWVLLMNLIFGFFYYYRTKIQPGNLLTEKNIIIQVHSDLRNELIEFVLREKLQSLYEPIYNNYSRHPGFEGIIFHWNPSISFDITTYQLHLWIPRKKLNEYRERIYQLLGNTLDIPNHKLLKINDVEYDKYTQGIRKLVLEKSKAEIEIEEINNSSSIFIKHNEMRKLFILFFLLLVVIIGTLVAPQRIDLGITDENTIKNQYLVYSRDLSSGSLNFSVAVNKFKFIYYKLIINLKEDQSVSAFGYIRYPGVSIKIDDNYSIYNRLSYGGEYWNSVDGLFEIFINSTAEFSFSLYSNHPFPLNRSMGILFTLLFFFISAFSTTYLCNIYNEREQEGPFNYLLNAEVKNNLWNHNSESINRSKNVHFRYYRYYAIILIMVIISHLLFFVLVSQLEHVLPSDIKYFYASGGLGERNMVVWTGYLNFIVLIPSIVIQKYSQDINATINMLLIWFTHISMYLMLSPTAMDILIYQLL